MKKLPNSRILSIKAASVISLIILCLGIMASVAAIIFYIYQIVMHPTFIKEMGPDARFKFFLKMCIPPLMIVIGKYGSVWTDKCIKTLQPMKG